MACLAAHAEKAMSRSVQKCFLIGGTACSLNNGESMVGYAVELDEGRMISIDVLVSGRSETRCRQPATERRERLRNACLATPQRAVAHLEADGGDGGGQDHLNHSRQQEEEP